MWLISLRPKQERRLPMIKLSRQISLGIMVMAIPLFMLSLGILYMQSHYLIHEEVKKNTQSTLNVSLQRVYNYINTIETSPDSLAASSFRQMAKLLGEVEQPYSNTYYILLDGDGRYLIHPDSTRLFAKTIFTDADLGDNRDMIMLGYEMITGKQGTIHINNKKKEYHVSYCPVKGTDWSLALICPVRDAMQSFYRLTYIVIALFIIGLLVILILCHHVMKQIVSPINRLIGTTQKIVDGQYDRTIPISPYKGVFAQLQNSFAKMQQSLNERMNHLRKEADELKRNNEEISRAKQEVEDTINKKNTFIVYLTQQMRMPLNVISGFADVLAKKGVDESISHQEELDNIATMMKNNVISMSRMELMMLDASETDASGLLLFTRFHEVSCNKIAREVINHVQRHYPYVNIQFETELQDTFHILTNRLFLLCVLIEPLYNAINYSDGKHISLRVSQTDTTVIFMIQDTGPGLPPDLPEMIYEPYTLPEDMPKGVGLGLPLARRHAKHLGGKLTIDPDYHDGCRIVIEMPK